MFGFRGCWNPFYFSYTYLLVYKSILTPYLIWKLDSMAVYIGWGILRETVLSERATDNFNFLSQSNNLMHFTWRTDMPLCVHSRHYVARLLISIIVSLTHMDQCVFLDVTWIRKESGNCLLLVTKLKLDFDICLCVDCVLQPFVWFRGPIITDIVCLILKWFYQVQIK